MTSLHLTSVYLTTDTHTTSPSALPRTGTSYRPPPYTARGDKGAVRGTLIGTADRRCTHIGRRASLHSRISCRSRIVTPFATLTRQRFSSHACSGGSCLGTGIRHDPRGKTPQYTPAGAGAFRRLRACGSAPTAHGCCRRTRHVLDLTAALCATAAAAARATPFSC